MFRLKTEYGFIFVDVIIALLILSVALLPIFGLFIQALRVNALASGLTIAGNLAQTQLELLKARPREYWRDLDLPCSIGWQDSRQLLPAYTVQTYAITAAVNNQLVQVTVVVYWQEAGIDRTAEFITYYSR